MTENRRAPMLIPDFNSTETITIATQDLGELANLSNLFLNKLKSIINDLVDSNQISTKYIDMATGETMTDEEVQEEKAKFEETVEKLKKL